METCRELIEHIVQRKQNIIAILTAHGAAVSEEDSLSSLPTLAAEIVSEADMLNANGLLFGSNSILVQNDPPTCPELEALSSPPTTIGGQCQRIMIDRGNLIKVLNTKGISIPTETLLSGIADYASKIRSKATIPNAQNKYFGMT